MTSYSLSPTQDLLDRLHLMLASELPNLSSTIPQHTISILSRIITLQLLKHNDIDDKTNLIDPDYSELLHSD